MARDWTPSDAADAADDARERRIEQGLEPHPMEADWRRSGIFVHHNCSYCLSGELPCREGSPSRCSNPMARND